jgi:hypothetical protein
MTSRRREAKESELTGVGGGHPRDARWRPELPPDDDETWGKRSTQE